MKFLVLAACLSLSSAQGFFGLQAHPNGAITPIDEPRVAAARADHLAAHGLPLGVGYAGLHSAGLHYADGYAYSGPLAGVLPLTAHPNGAVVPVDEPAVAAARADHLAAHGAYAPVAAAIAPVAAYAPTYAAGYSYSGPLAGVLPLTSYPNGAVVPVDEPAVAAARADHLAAHGAYAPVAAAIAPAAAVAPTYAAGYSYSGPLAGVLPLTAYPNGAVVPLDEPAVAAARADHLAAHGAYAPVAAVHAAAPVAAFAPAYGYSGYTGPLAGALPLVAHPNGAVVPVDEPAVAAARADHLAAHGL